LNPGPHRTIPHKNTKCKAVIPSSLDYRTQPAEYSYLFFDLNLLILIPQRTIFNGNKNKMQNMPPTKRARITDWSIPIPADIKVLPGVVTSVSRECSEACIISASGNLL
jgi:hypothetical protein